jgi:hypothetical protein
MSYNYLFNEGKLEQYLEDEKNRLKSEIEACENNRLIENGIEIAQQLADKYLKETVQILFDEKTIEQETIKVDDSGNPCRDTRGKSPFFVDGIQITVILPFIGSEVYLRLKSSRIIGSPPKGEIINKEIHLKYKKAGYSKGNLPSIVSSLKNQIDGDINIIKEWSGWANNDITIFNNSIPQFIENCIKRRVENLRLDKEFVSLLEIPLRKREIAPRTYELPLLLQ